MSPLPLVLLAALAAPQSSEEDQRSPWQKLAEGETIPVEQVLFILNEEVITLSMAEEGAARQMLQAKNQGEELPVQVAMQRSLANLVYDLIALEGFRRLGMDESLLDQEITMRIDRLIETAGSRARFEEGLRADGFTTLSFRDYLKSRLIMLTWRGVVVGEQPSPLQGFRSRPEPTPSEIRAEFDANSERWEQGFELVWEVLQCHDNGSGAGLGRAQAIADALAAGTMTLEEARRSAQSTATHRGDPATRNLQPRIRDFLLGAEPGAVSSVEPIPNIGGLLCVVVSRSPARTIGFEEAQARIAVDLRKRKSDALVTAAGQALLHSSYTWYPDEISGFMRSFFGNEDPPRETEF